MIQKLAEQNLDNRAIQLGVFCHLHQPHDLRFLSKSPEATLLPIFKIEIRHPCGIIMQHKKFQQN